MLSLDEENIRKWYRIITNYKNSSRSDLTRYCEEIGIRVQQFSDMNGRFFYKQHSNPELYAELLYHSQQLKSGTDKISQYCKKHNVDQRYLAAMNTHLKYKEIAERMDLHKELPMNFIPIKPIRSKSPAKLPNIPQKIEDDVVELLDKQNDIELTISAGIKVCISPNVSSMKIIRIIELLKDL